MNSPTVSGIVSSSIVVTTSTNGTSATTARNSSGRWLTTAPMSSPPALPPSMASIAGVVRPAAISFSAQAMKSSKVVCFLAILPASYQLRPRSPPPRMWPIAKTTPRSSSETRDCENVASIGMP